MTREQAINYLFSCGFTNEQVGEVVRALTYESARLSVEEVTALAEWTEKLTKASEEAYNKGFADGANEVLDKIRAEIEQTVSRYSISRERGCMGQVEWSDRLIKESEVLQILDKYKAETEAEDGKID